jgi:hypothetical protein
MLWIGIAIVAVITTWLVWAKHRIDWLEKQTPIGVWSAKRGTRDITLAFEGGPKEGIYRQITKRGSLIEREFGHWAIKLGDDLYMLVMASDVPRHPRFGQDTKYRIWYRNPDSIGIDGPDRKAMRFARAPAGTTVEFDLPIPVPPN